MRVVVIGGTGHVGSYLVPGLFERGYEVISISRGNRKPYQNHFAWKQIQQVTIDREKEESSQSFAKKILSLKPDVVVDMICYTLPSARQLADGLEGKIQHFLHCGTIWVHGYSVEVPTTEEQPRNPFGEYGIEKAAIEKYLTLKARTDGFPVTMLHPGHIVGPGWNPVNPAGNLNVEVFAKLASGRELVLPNLGMETVHHVHADDVAQAFIKAIENRNRAIGESFHVVSSGAMTLRGYAEKMAAWFGRQAHLSFMPFDRWKATVSEEEARITYDHIAHSPNCSIAKARHLLNYQPRYSSIQAVCESVRWLIRHGMIST